VRQVIMLLNNSLRWFENNLHTKIISLFAKEHLSLQDLPGFVKEVFGIKIRESGTAQEFTEKQQRYMDGFLCKVLGVEKGLDATFAQFAGAMKALSLDDFQDCLDQLEALSKSNLFDKKGVLVEDRPKIFHHLEEIIEVLDRAIQGIRFYTERLEVALNIKTHVFGYLPQVVSYRADVDELRSKMGNYPYLTVTSRDEDDKMIPLGVVRARDLQEPILGTVTLRDFCNRDETKIPSYFEVISVIDHHKTVLNTSSAPVVYISDAQSSNSVVAQLAFEMNDKYSTGGMSPNEIQEQLHAMQKDLDTPSGKRVFQKLLQRLSIALNVEHSSHAYFVDPLREFVEYLHFLYAILDDTDLLTKVSKRDVECVASLLNRLKSLMLGEEVEILFFDDLEQNGDFVEMAAARILQHPDMYSLYRKIYLAKEHLVEENLVLCAGSKESSLFVDTKLQNSCVRIGQTKMFANNFASYEKYADKMRESWAKQSREFFVDRREFDLHLHMISTIKGAEDLFSGAGGDYHHKDELWAWIPMTEQSIEHLKGFLNAFRSSPQIKKYQKDLEVELLGSQAGELSKIFKESFLDIPHKISLKKGKGLSLAILRYPAGAINSRKAMISPYLPKLLS